MTERVESLLFTAGQQMSNGAAKEAERTVDEASRNDASTIAGAVVSVLQNVAAQVAAQPSSLGTHASTLQLATSLLGRCILRDWASNWSSNIGGDSAQSVKSFIEGFLMEHSTMLARRDSQSCLGNLADIWAAIVKLRVGDAKMADNQEAVVAELVAMRDALMVLCADDSCTDLAQFADPTGQYTVCRMVVQRAVEEFGLFSIRSQRRGLPLVVHDFAREEFHTHVLPDLWSRCVSAWLYFIDLSSAEGAMENSMHGLSGGMSYRGAWALLRLLHAMLCWRFNRAITSTGQELGQDDGTPAVLAVIRGQVWKEALQQVASDGTTTLVSSITNIVIEAATQPRRFGDNYVAAGPFVLASAHMRDELRSVASEALVQLCSIYGSNEEGWSNEDRASYAMGLVQTVLVASQSVVDSAARDCDHGAALLTCTAALERVVSSIGTTTLFEHPDLTTFHEQARILTEGVIRQSLEFSMNYEDDASEAEQQIAEALDKLLRMWTMILHAAFGDVTNRCRLDKLGASIPLADCAMSVFEAYVTGKVSEQLQAPDGSVSRRMIPTLPQEQADTAGGASDHSSEFTLNHLQSVGLLGREAPDRAASFLSNALQLVVSRLMETMQQHGCGPPPNVCEALWYLLRLTGAFMADDDTQERPCIPSPICMYSVRVERDLSVSGIEGCDDPQQRAVMFEDANEVYALVKAMFGFAAMVEEEMRRGADLCVFPPSVVEALTFALHRFVASYLAADEDIQADFAEAFRYAFDEGIRAAASCLSFVATGLATFPYEPTCAKECLLALQALTDKASLSQWMLGRPEVHSFLSVGIGNGNFQLPCESRGALIGLLCSIASQASNAVDLDQGYLLDDPNCVATPSLATTQVLRHTCEIHPVCLVDTLREPIASVVADSRIPLDTNAATAIALTIRGTLRHLRNPNVVAEVVEALLPVLSDLCTVVSLDSPYSTCHPLITATLNVLDTAIDSCSTFLPTQLVDVAMELVATVVQSALARLRVAFARHDEQQQENQQYKSAQAEAEEEERIELLQGTINVILACASWGAFDLSNFESDPEADQQRLARVSDTVVRGLIDVLSVVWNATTVLQVPPVSAALYRLLREVADTHTEALLQKPTAEEANAILWFVGAAFDVADCERNRCAFNVVEALARHAKRGENAAGLSANLGAFLDMLWRVFATCAVDLAAVTSHAWAVYAVAGVLGAEAVYGSWQQAFHTQQSSVDPESPAGKTVDAMVLETLQNTDFSGGRVKLQQSFASDLGAALAVLRGASVTL